MLVVDMETSSLSAVLRWERAMRAVTVAAGVADDSGMSSGAGGEGGVGMSPLVRCSGRRLLADRHSLPFPWTLSLRRRWCPLASHRPVSFLILLGLSFPLHFPFLSLGRLCQRSPRTVSVSLTGRHGGGQQPSLLAGGVQAVIPNRRCGTPPQQRLLGPGAGMHEKGRHTRGRPRSGYAGGWRSLPKRLGAVTGGYKRHGSWHLCQGDSGGHRLGALEGGFGTRAR